MTEKNYQRIQGERRILGRVEETLGKSLDAMDEFEKRLEILETKANEEKMEEIEMRTEALEKITREDKVEE